MTRSVVRAGTDVWLSSTSPSKKYGRNPRLRLKANENEALIRFRAPFPRGATILSAKLVLTQCESFAGSVTVSAQRYTGNWVESTASWNKHPRAGNVAGAVATMAKTNPGAGTVWEIPLTPQMVDVAAGSTYHGIRLWSSSASLLRFWSLDAGSRQPYLVVEWTTGPAKPSLLKPNGGVVNSAKPVLATDFTDHLGSTSMQAIQVQIDAANDFTSGIDFDSGTVTTSTPQLDLASTAYAGLAEGATTYWRCRVRDGDGIWSPWSDSASMTRYAKGVVTVTSPAAGPELKRNYIHDPSTNDGTVAPWGAYSTSNALWVTLLSLIKGNRRALQAHRNEQPYDLAQLFTDGSVTGKTTVDGWGIQSGSTAPVIDTTRHFFGGASVKFNQGSGTGNYIGQKSITISATPTAGQLKESTAYRAYARFWIPSAKTVLTGLRLGGSGVVAAAETTTPARNQWVVVTHDFTTKLAADGTVIPQIRGGGDAQDVWLDAFWIEEVASTLPGSMGLTTTTGVTSRPAGTKVTMSAEVMLPVGSLITSVRFIGRDNPNNDSLLIENGSVSAGAQFNSVPADGEWRRIFVTFTVPAGRNLTSYYVYGTGAGNLGEHLHARDLMINDGDLVDFFDGDSLDTYPGEYSWSGAQYASASVHYDRSLVEDLTPTITWSFAPGAGESQTHWQVRIARADNPAVYIHDTGKQAGADTAYTVPKNVLADDTNYRLWVRCWDTKYREATADDPVFGEHMLEFRMKANPLWEVPSNVQVTQTRIDGTGPLPPWVEVSWTFLGTPPAAWSITRDGKPVDNDLDAADVTRVGTTFKYIDATARPGVDHTWTVRAKVNGSLSTPGSATYTPEVEGIWVFDPLAPTTKRFVLAGDDYSAASDDLAETYQVLGSPAVVRTVMGLTGLSGAIGNGSLYSRSGAPSLTWDAMEEIFYGFKSRPTDVFRLVMGDLNIPVVLGNMRTVPDPQTTKRRIRKMASFSWWQYGEFPFDGEL